MHKLDNWLYAKMTQLVRRWVKKNKFEKHKIDLAIKISKVEMFVYVACGIYLSVKTILQHHDYFFAGFLFAAWMLMLFLDFMRMQSLKELKESYDWLWAMRKNPNVYNDMKIFCELQKENNYEIRKFMLLMNVVFFSMNIVFFSPVAIVFVFNFFHLYIREVFDFDEPDERKRAKDSVTDIIKEKLKMLVERVSPQPTPQGV